MLALGEGGRLRRKALSLARCKDKEGTRSGNCTPGVWPVSLARAPQGEPGTFASRGDKYDYDDEVGQTRDSTNLFGVRLLSGDGHMRFSVTS